MPQGQGIIGENTCGRDEHIISLMFVIVIFGAVVIIKQELFSRFKFIQRALLSFVIVCIVINHIYTTYAPGLFDTITRNVALTFASVCISLIVATELVRSYSDALIGFVVCLYALVDVPVGVAVPLSIVFGMMVASTLRHYPFFAATPHLSDIITTAILKSFPLVVTVFNISITPDRGQNIDCYTIDHIPWNYPTNGFFICDDRCKTAAKSTGWMNGTSGGSAVMMVVVFVVAVPFFFVGVKHKKVNLEAAATESTPQRLGEANDNVAVATGQMVPVASRNGAPSAETVAAYMAATAAGAGIKIEMPKAPKPKSPAKVSVRLPPPGAAVPSPKKPPPRPARPALPNDNNDMYVVENGSDITLAPSDITIDRSALE